MDNDINTGMEHLEKLINSKFDITNLKLDTMNDHLSKLNGKVAKHEKIINEAIVERAGNRQKQEDYFKDFDEVIGKVKEIEKQEQEHLNKCPQANKIRIIEDHLLTQSSMKKYQAKLFLISTTVLGLLIGVIGIWIKLGAA